VVPEITVGFGAQWTFMAYRRLVMKATVPQYTCYQRNDNYLVFCKQQSSADGSVTISAVRPDGKILPFTKGSNGWESDRDVAETLIPVLAADGSTVQEWVVATPAGDREHYDSTGVLLSIEHTSGGSHRYTYSDGTTNDSNISRLPQSSPVCSNTQSGRTVGAGHILCITDDWGRQLNFEYDAKDRVSTIISPNGERYAYAYDGASGGCAVYSTGNQACSAGNLTSVTYPDGKSRLYHYNEKSLINSGTACANMPAAGTGQLPFLTTLTGLTDENGARYAKWGYNCSKQVISSEHAGGVEKVTVSYGGRATDGSQAVTVTSNTGTSASPTTIVRNYHYFLLLGTTKNDSVDKRCNGCGDFASRAYDTRGNVVSSTDWNGKLTQYFYEPVRNLEIKRIEAKGSTVERTISTVWHPAFELPVQVWEPKRVTTYEYDDNRRLLSRTEQATTDLTGAQGTTAASSGLARTWNYSYNSVGQLLTVTGPRKDVVDITSYSYDVRGNLETVTNALGQVTRYANYDGNGRVGQVIAPNGLITDVLYNSRGLVSSQTTTDGTEIETTRFDYDGVGQLTKVTLADGSFLSYTYDPAHRLTNVSDSVGNSVTYTLDYVGNRIAEQTTGQDGVLVRKISRVFDNLDNLIQVTGGAQ
jgi:YD repeat-containing protein